MEPERLQKFKKGLKLMGKLKGSQLERHHFWLRNFLRHKLLKVRSTYWGSTATICPFLGVFSRHLALACELLIGTALSHLWERRETLHGLPWEAESVWPKKEKGEKTSDVWEISLWGLKRLKMKKSQVQQSIWCSWDVQACSCPISWDVQGTVQWQDWLQRWKQPRPAPASLTNLSAGAAGRDMALGRARCVRRSFCPYQRGSCCGWVLNNTLFSPEIRFGLCTSNFQKASHINSRTSSINMWPFCFQKRF